MKKPLVFRQIKKDVKKHLKDLAIVYITHYEPCYVINHKRNRLVQLDQKTARLLTEVRYKWNVYLAIFIQCDDEVKMLSKEIQFQDPILQKDTINYLNEAHQELGKDVPQHQYISAAWLAKPYPYSWNPEKAFSILSEMGADSEPEKT